MQWLKRGRRSAVLLWFVAPIALFDAGPLRAEETALDRYVAKPDTTYAWQVVRRVSSPGLTQYVVDLKSQTWRTEKDVDHPVWQHWLSIVKPAKPASRIAFLRITGGANGGEPPQSAEPATLKLAEATNSVVAELKMVPNQPLVLNHDGVPRKEDDFIVYTWDQFLKTGDETWPARLPMVKSAVRAMDCVQELLASDQGGRFGIEKFVVSGGSKRGWTTWCTAAVDPRVAAAIPIVIDVINVPACSRHHIAVYGFYSEAMGDYVRHNIKGRANDPKLKLLYAIEDPYSYRERLTMPKFVVNASGDQYFPPDSSQFYFGDLPGEKYLRYVPNADHSLRDSDAQESIIAFYQTILAGSRRPKYAWTFESDGSIRVQTADAPKAVQLWQATNPSARDFRVKTIGKAYKSQTLRAEGGVYVGKIDPPEKGWTAFFVELTFDVNQSFPLKLSTAVRILPDTLPYAGLDPAKAPLEARPSSAQIGGAAIAQTKAPLPPLPAPQAVPRPATDTGQPYAPQSILSGGIVVPLFPPDSPYLKADKVHVPEVYNLSQTVHGRISSIVSIHNPSIEIHRVEKGINTGTAVIVIAGGGHRTLNVGGESADFVQFFYNYGINTVILRNRLRADGYVAEVDAVHDAQQAVRVVRAYAKELGIDPNRIGVMGFSAGAELAAPAALLYEDWDKKNNEPSDPFAGISSRPDFAGIIYPGPTPFAHNRTAPLIPKDVPPAFLTCGSAGDRGHAIWALEYYQAMLMAGVPNVELHLYGNGRHPGDPLPDGSRMSGGLTDRNNIPFGTWQYRFIDWARDLGFLQKPGIETKAAKDVAAYVANPPRPYGQGR